MTFLKLGHLQVMALQSAMKSGLIKLRPLLNRSATQYIKQRTEILKWVLVIQAERVSLCACIKCLLWEIDHLSMEERYEMGRSLSHSAWRALCESAEDCMRLSPARCLCMEPSKCLRALFGDATRLFLQARSELLATEDSLETQLGLVDAAVSFPRGPQRP